MSTRDLKAELKTIHEEIEHLRAKRRAIYEASLQAASEDKLCSDAMAEMVIQAEEPHQPPEPIVVSHIHWTAGHLGKPIFETAKGTWVAVRPCAKEHEGRTFLGILIGRFALCAVGRYDREAEILHLSYSHHNPTIYVPDLGKVVFGIESWWSEIKGPEDLRQITNADIENVWYVRVLRDLEKIDAEPY